MAHPSLAQMPGTPCALARTAGEKQEDIEAELEEKGYVTPPNELETDPEILEEIGRTLVEGAQKHPEGHQSLASPQGFKVYENDAGGRSGHGTTSPNTPRAAPVELTEVSVTMMPPPPANAHPVSSPAPTPTAGLSRAQSTKGK